jgi:hypothetical protein
MTVPFWGFGSGVLARQHDTWEAWGRWHLCLHGTQLEVGVQAEAAYGDDAAHCQGRCKDLLLACARMPASGSTSNIA